MTVPGVGGRDIADLLAPQGARRQPMPGFDPIYTDIVDYILRCTHRIWEQKDLGLITTHYAPDCVIRSMTGETSGVVEVIANTTRTLAAFPDRTLVGEAVIWSEEGPGRYLSSHRITSQGTNVGPSEFGPPTGRPVQFLTIADCLCEANRIVEEWLVRDNSALVMGLGLHPRIIARGQAEADKRAGPAAWRQAAMARVLAEPASPFPDTPLPDGGADPVGFAKAMFDGVWNHRRFGLVRSAYSPAVRWYGPGARRLFGWGEVTGWAIALIGSFGDAKFRIDHIAHVTDEAGGTDIAVRWEMAGMHDGHALYGAPTGAPVYILGVTHWRVQHGKIVEETTTFDEVALLRQIEGGL